MSKQSPEHRAGGMQKRQTGGYEVIIPPPTLREKALRPSAGRRSELQAIERAEKALEALSCNFEDWMRREVNSLLQARARYKSDPNKPETLQTLLRIAHDMKGQASTLKYPYVTRVCMSLCSLIEDVPSKNRIPMELVDQHVDAVNAIVKEGVRTDTHPTAEALVVRLTAVTADYVACEIERAKAAEATASAS